MMRFTLGFIVGLVGGAVAVFLLLSAVETAKRRQLQKRIDAIQAELNEQQRQTEKLRGKLETMSREMVALGRERQTLEGKVAALREENRRLKEALASAAKQRKTSFQPSGGGTKFMRGAVAAAIKGLFTGQSVPRKAVDELGLSAPEKMALEEALKDEANRMTAALTDFAKRKGLKIPPKSDLFSVVATCFRACSEEFRKLQTDLSAEDLLALQTGKKRLSDFLGKKSVLVELAKLLAKERYKTHKLLERDLPAKTMRKLRETYLRIDVFKFLRRTPDGKEWPLTLNFYRQGIEPDE